MELTYTAFVDASKKIATGDLAEVAEGTKAFLLKHQKANVLIFDDQTGAQVEIDFRGSTADVRKRAERMMEASRTTDDSDKKVGPGRPRLGVIAKEVTLLPTHWDWLASQPGGASVTLRKLVDAAKKKNQGRDEMRRAQEATYKFLLATSGNRPHYEEALRALYAQDKTKFKKLMEAWPNDIRDHALRIATPSFKP